MVQAIARTPNVSPVAFPGCASLDERILCEQCGNVNDVALLS